MQKGGKASKLATRLMNNRLPVVVKDRMDGGGWIG
jgi:hypothetical protein